MLNRCIPKALLLVAVPFLLMGSAEAKELKWPKRVAGKVVDALSSKGDEPLTALMTLKEVRDSAKKLKPENVAFLEEEIRNLQSTVLERLRTDYRAAKERRDIRGALIALAIADKVEERDLGEESARKIEELLRSDGEPSHEVWRLGDVSGTYLTQPYTEGGSATQFTARPVDGHRLLRVSATVTNVDGRGDDKYSLWALSSAKRLLAGMAVEKAGPDPVRWLDNDLIYAVAPGGERYPCGVVVEYRGGRGLDGTVMYSQNMKFLAPRFLAQGESVEAEVLCSVPEDVGDLALLVVGAGPVPIPISATPVAETVP